MRRDIKFRGKHVESGEWIVGCLFQDDDDHLPMIHQRGTLDGWEQVKEDSVGQFTGLCDKNGIEIYEGDVVEGFCYNDFYTGIEGNVNAVVRWIDAYAGFMFDINAQYFHDMRDARKIEIIGNVFDNPELLSNYQ